LPDAADRATQDTNKGKLPVIRLLLRDCENSHVFRFESYVERRRGF